MLAECFEHLPAGVVNILAGAGEVGEAIVADERVDCVAFTGSVETGKKIAHVCAERVARINLEMGGKDPFIVCADVAAAIEVAAQGRRLGRLPQRRPGLHLGRALLRRSSRSTTTTSQAFVDTPSSSSSATRSTPSTDIGPMVSARQRAKVVAQVEAAAAAGAEVVTGGDRRRQRHAATSSRRPSSPAPPPRPTCCARRPSARSRRSSRSRSWTRRSSSPTGREFGLGANVYTQDLETTLRCMRELRAGTVWFNDPLTDNDAGPFGGFKQSGLGRELGREGLEAFQETKHVHIET